MQEIYQRIEAEMETHDKNARIRMFTNIMSDGIVGTALLSLVCADLGTDGHHTVRVILFVAAGIKLLILIPTYIIIYILWKLRILHSYLYPAYLAILIILYLPFSIYCMIEFFDKNRGVKHHAVPMYIGLLYLLIESFLVMTSVCWLFTLIIIVLILVCSQMVEMQNRAEQNLRMSNLINQVDFLRITGDRFGHDDICQICTENLNNGNDVIRLPWDERHYFHRVWIAEWFIRSAVCPIWRSEINEAALENFRARIGADQPQQRDYGNVSRTPSQSHTNSEKLDQNNENNNLGRGENEINDKNNETNVHDNEDDTESNKNN